jgi:CBS domain-containing protein
MQKMLGSGESIEHVLYFFSFGLYSPYDMYFTSDIRHLPLVDELGEVVGIVSIKDLIKTCLEEKEHTIESLASFAVGEGGHFVM